MPDLVAREHTLTRVNHPDPLRQDGISARVLIVDPVADPLAKGDPTFGWEGDPRLALYLDVPGGRWELWRNETGRYRRLATAPASGPRPMPVGDVVPSLILWLVTHDQRRGYDPVVEVDRVNARTEAAAKADADAWHDDIASRLVHALRKDGIDP